MNWSKNITYNKRKLIIFTTMYLPFLFFQIIVKNMFVKSCWQFCELKPTYKVPNIFPGASQCGTICATKIELIFGYIWMIITQFIVPAIILYVIISLIINKISNNKFS